MDGSSKRKEVGGFEFHSQAWVAILFLETDVLLRHLRAGCGVDGAV